ncbi:hypothetical protein [Shewanella algae]|uniref:hypothetical protein n=1 Tax=Shewanella algae TaxID=38313 RepID=UPI001C5828FF|nr:hypothetical protein [Shewanella algae]
MINFAIRRKRRDFKEGNLELYRILAILFYLISPIMLILAPLPGYLLIESDYFYVKLFSVLFFTVLSLVESFLYLSFWSRKELLYFIYSQGRVRAFFSHLTYFISTRVLFAVFVFSAFFRVDFFHLSYVVTCYSLLFLMFFYFYKIKVRLSRKMKSDWGALLLVVKLARLSFSNGVKVRMVIVIAILILSFVFQSSSIDIRYLVFYLIAFFLIIMFLFWSTLKLVNINILANSIFLKSVGFSLYYRYSILVRLILFFIFLLSTFLNFLILIFPK